jgi:hypothetical protein
MMMRSRTDNAETIKNPERLLTPGNFMSFVKRDSSDNKGDKPMP